MTLLEQIQKLKTQQPDVGGSGDRSGVILVYGLGRYDTIIVRFDDTALEPAAYLDTGSGHPAPAWYLNTNTWEELTRDLHTQALFEQPNEDAGLVPYAHFDEAVTEFRNHLASLAWLVRLIREIER